MNIKILLAVLVVGLLLGYAQTQPSGTSQPGTGTQDSAGPSGIAVTYHEQEATQPQEQQEEAEPGLESKEISYYSGGWTIYGTLYESKNPSPKKAVILLHGLGGTRASYPDSFIESLHNEIPDAVVLAIDMRGHGKSNNLGSWQSFDSAMFKDMKTDAVAVQDYFTDPYPTINSFYLVGASMGSTAALLAGAQSKNVAKVAMISPGTAYRDVEVDRAAETYLHPVLLVAASGDSYSATSAESIRQMSGSSQATVRIYGGISDHGTELFGATENDPQPLEDVIIDFLK